jgi:hypothetical protein
LLTPAESRNAAKRIREQVFEFPTYSPIQRPCQTLFAFHTRDPPLGAISVFLPWFTISAEGLGVRMNLTETPNLGDGFGIAQAGPGFGIWISLLASVGTIAAAWALKNPGDTLKGGFRSL